ncbi:nuclear pore complex protein Nup98-Nup96-like protein [Dinothrombium tinctorium]|uniref:Nuclear pore complex protein Nup98-Nup96 n=1 Tax=Dinothrombium tinctorium TaxID=1965070 RepID=A0A443Q7I1_9ACAR|nr:nuclear pore complex protein Nup98-Nup96-like protein [Dinothrombium tinctorium]
MLKNNVNINISTHHQCITCMREYETKSLEELRFEDYQANRKGPQVGTVFGSTARTSLFNPSTSVSFNIGSSGGLFGAGKTTFDTNPTTTSTTSIFNPLFNKPVGFIATGTSPFGAVQPQQQQTSIFGQTSTSSFTSPNFFSGTQNNTQKSVFGATTTQPSLFNTSTTNTGLGKTNLFGNQTQSFTGFSFNPTTISSLFSSQPSLFNRTADTTIANETLMFSFPSQLLGVQQPTS